MRLDIYVEENIFSEKRFWIIFGWSWRSQKPAHILYCSVYFFAHGKMIFSLWMYSYIYSSALWSDWDGEDALPCDGIRQWWYDSSLLQHTHMHPICTHTLIHCVRKRYFNVANYIIVTPKKWKNYIFAVSH